MGRGGRRGSNAITGKKSSLDYLDGRLAQVVRDHAPLTNFGPPLAKLAVFNRTYGHYKRMQSAEKSQVMAWFYVFLTDSDLGNVSMRTAKSYVDTIEPFYVHLSISGIKAKMATWTQKQAISRQALSSARRCERPTATIEDCNRILSHAFTTEKGQLCQAFFFVMMATGNRTAHIAALSPDQIQAEKADIHVHWGARKKETNCPQAKLYSYKWSLQPTETTRRIINERWDKVVAKVNPSHTTGTGSSYMCCWLKELLQRGIILNKIVTSSTRRLMADVLLDGGHNVSDERYQLLLDHTPLTARRHYTRL